MLNCTKIFINWHWRLSLSFYEKMHPSRRFHPPHPGTLFCYAGNERRIEIRDQVIVGYRIFPAARLHFHSPCSPLVIKEECQGSGKIALKEQARILIIRCYYRKSNIMWFFSFIAVEQSFPGTQKT